MGIVFGLGQHEEPPHRVLVKEGPYEIREYAPRLIAEVEVEGDMYGAGNTGFRQIANFIFGNNVAPRAGSAEAKEGAAEKIAMTVPVTMEPAAAAPGSQAIAMTVPVTMEASGSSSSAATGSPTPAAVRKWKMNFFMPSQYTLETLPRPVNPNVHIRQVPPQTFAVVTFSGWTYDTTLQEREQEVRDWMGQRADYRVDTSKPAQLARYNPPWSIPFLRRNEVLCAVEKLAETERMPAEQTGVAK